MPKLHQPHSGSMAYWPRKRSSKTLPSVNWSPVKEKSIQKGLLGFIGYKAGMARLLVKDNTNDSRTKGKQIIVPITIIECPPQKILSVRFHKDKNILFETINTNLDKELKRKIKFPKNTKISLDDAKKRLNEIDNITAIAYSIPKKIKSKKTPDLLEIGIGGDLKEKFEFIKENINKEFLVKDIFAKNQIVDIKGLTRGLGNQGPVKRFGIGLKSHKAEKGQRRPGNLGPWTPSRVSFRVPQLGQTGFFSRIKLNNKIMDIQEGQKITFEIENYGKILGDVLFIKGSIQGTPKRQLIIYPSPRQKRRTTKENFEVIKLLK